MASGLEEVQNGALSALFAESSTLLDTMATSMPSLRNVAKLALGGAQVLLSSGSRVLGGPSMSCSNPQLSCHNTTAVTDFCCFNSPGGQMLQTQFWDAHPTTGPVDSWTIHGLWWDIPSWQLNIAEEHMY